MLFYNRWRRLNKILAEKIKTFSRRPGVYLFKNAKNAVLYIGKAKNLRDRVKSYFAKTKDSRAQIEFLIKKTSDIDFIVTDTEKEALLLENTLIKAHRPRYNLNLRDDKSYISIKISAAHNFPGISLTRKIKKAGSIYFGPYDSSFAAREAVELITRYFRIRSCADTEFANRLRPCLKFDIGRCTAPCVDRISKEDYLAQVEEAKMFLSGESKTLIKHLEKKMQEASGALGFEEAARLRDVILMLKGLVEKQKVVKHGGADQDVIGISEFENRRAICLLKVRGGALIGKKIFTLPESVAPREKVIEEFLLQHYREPAQITSLIATSDKPEASETLASILSERRGLKIKLTSPSKGDLAKLIELASTNAREALIQRFGSSDISTTLENLGKKMGLHQPPCIIECVDISNLDGKDAVGSLVNFVDGSPNKSHYRIYNIRTLNTPDDYGMMNETLTRRFIEPDINKFAPSPSPLPRGERVRERVTIVASAQERPLPDLLLVDGGKGQLAVAKKVLDEIGVKVPIAAIAKAESKKSSDQIFIPGRKNPLKFKRGSKELLLLMKIRDEAHRFGINAHRKRRNKAAFK